MAKASKIAGWSFGDAKSSFFTLADSAWTTITSDSLVIPEDGLYRVSWQLMLEARTPGFLWSTRTTNFELRVELNGSYVYTYAPPAAYEDHGCAAVHLRKGTVDGFLLARCVANSVVIFRHLLVEVFQLEGE